MMNTKKDFFNKLINLLGENDYFLTADLGYGALDDIKKKLGDRFVNVGVAEQTMISMASGLALAGKRVFTYTISSFYMRALEQIKLDIYGQKAQGVFMIGSGTLKYGYKNFGLSHEILEKDMDILDNYVDIYEIEGLNGLASISKLIVGDSKLLLLAK